MTRPCPPELQRRAVAFDRVMTALLAVAALSQADLDEVSDGAELGPWHRLVRAVRASRDAAASLAPADRELNAALEALDEDHDPNVAVADR